MKMMKGLTKLGVVVFFIAFSIVLVSYLYSNSVDVKAVGIFSSLSNKANITIINTGSATTLTDYQIWINLTRPSDMRTDYIDLNFSYYNYSTGVEYPIDYFIENYTSSYALVWLELPYIQGSVNTTVSYYWNNNTAISSSSNASRTFLLYENCDDVTDWTTIVPSEITSNSTAAFTYDGNTCQFRRWLAGGITAYRTWTNVTKFYIYADLLFYTTSSGGIGFGRLLNQSFAVFGTHSPDNITAYSGTFQRIIPATSPNWYEVRLYNNNSATSAWAWAGLADRNWTSWESNRQIGVDWGEPDNFGALVIHETGNYKETFLDNIFITKANFPDVEPTYYVEMILSNSLALVSPVDQLSSYTSGSSNINFTFTPTFYQTIQNCSLWLNSTGTWALNISNSSSILNNGVNGINQTLTQGAYLWNIQCWNSTGGIFSTSNYTLTLLNTTFPFSYLFNSTNITINNTGSSTTLTDYQIWMNISRAAAMQSDYSDLRFSYYNYSTGGESAIDYFIEYSNSNYALVWVEIPYIQGSVNTIVSYYWNNTTAVTSGSNPDSVFPFYENCSSVADWTVTSPSTITSDATVSYDGNTCNFIRGVSAGSYTAYKSFTNPSKYYLHFVLRYDGNSNGGMSIGSGSHVSDGGVFEVLNFFNATGFANLTAYHLGRQFIIPTSATNWYEVMIYTNHTTPSGADTAWAWAGLADRNWTSWESNRQIDYDWTPEDYSLISFYSSSSGTATYVDDIFVTKANFPGIEPTYYLTSGTAPPGPGSENSVVLSSPSDLNTTYTYASANVNFTFTPTFYQTIQNCSLWLNSTGTWALNRTNSTLIQNNTLNGINQTLSPGAYLWNIQCWNSTTGTSASPSRTITISGLQYGGWYGMSQQYNNISSVGTNILGVTINSTSQIKEVFLATDESGTWKNATYTADIAQNAYRFAMFDLGWNNAVQKEDVICFAFQRSGYPQVYCWNTTSDSWTSGSTPDYIGGNSHLYPVLTMNRTGHIIIATSYDSGPSADTKIRTSCYPYNPTSWCSSTNFANRYEQQISAFGNGTVILFFKNEPYNDRQYYRLTEDGVSFSSEVDLIVNDESPAGQYSGELHTSGNKLYVAWSDVVATPPYIRHGPFFFMYDNGWKLENGSVIIVPPNQLPIDSMEVTQNEPLDKAHYTGGVDVSPNGNIIISYMNMTALKSLVWNGATWTKSLVASVTSDSATNLRMIDAYAMNDTWFVIYSTPLNAYGYTALHRYESYDSGQSWIDTSTMATSSANSTYRCSKVKYLNNSLFNSGVICLTRYGYPPADMGTSESISTVRMYLENLNRRIYLNNSTGNFNVNFTWQNKYVGSGRTINWKMYIIYANGTESMTSTMSFNTSMGDAPPQYSAVTTSYPSTYSSTQKTWMNVTWTDYETSVSQVFIESNISGTPYNYTPSLSGSIYYLSYNLPAGNYYWKSYARDTLNQWNTLSSQAFTISKATPTGTLSSSGGWWMTSPTSTTISYSESNGGDSDVDYCVYLDNVCMGDSYAFTPTYGTYAFKLNAIAGTYQNYTVPSSMDDHTLTVSTTSEPSTPVIHLALNGTEGNVTWNNQTNINITGWIENGDLTLFETTTTPSSYSCIGSCYSSSNINDGDWNSYSNLRSTTGYSFVFENWTLPENFIDGNVTIKVSGYYSSIAGLYIWQSAVWNFRCWDYSSNSWHNLGTYVIADPTEIELGLDDTCLLGNTVILNSSAYFTYLHSANYYEARIDWSTQSSLDLYINNVAQNTTSFYGYLSLGTNNITLYYSGSSSYYPSTTTYWATVYAYGQLNLTVGASCPAYWYDALNITMWNESTRTMTPGTVDVTFTLYSIQTNEAMNFSSRIAGNSSYQVCVYPNYTYYSLDAVAQFYNSSWSSIREYNIYQMNLSSVTQEVRFYMLQSTIGSKIMIKLQDSSSYVLPGYMIQIQRYYPEINEYQTVVVPKTDNNGETNTYLVPYDVYYKFIILKDGTIKDVLGPMFITTTTLTLTTTTPTIYEYYQFMREVAYGCSFINATKYITCSIVNTNNLVTSACLNVTKDGILSSTEICHVCSSGASFSLSCALGEDASGSYTYGIEMFTDFPGSITSMKEFWKLNIAGMVIFGLEGVIFAIFIIGILSFVGIWNPAVGVILTIIGFAAVLILGIIPPMWNVLITMSFIGIIIIYKVRT